MTLAGGGGGESYYPVTSGCQRLFSEIYEIAAMKRRRLLKGTHIAETVPGAASLGTRGLANAVIFAVPATSVRGDLHLQGARDMKQGFRTPFSGLSHSDKASDTVLGAKVQIRQLGASIGIKVSWVHTCLLTESLTTCN